MVVNRKKVTKLETIVFLALTPFIIIYLLLLDLIFIINTSIFHPLCKLLGVCGLKFLSNIPDKIENSYEVLFDMERLDVAGFRR